MIVTAFVPTVRGLAAELLLLLPLTLLMGLTGMTFFAGDLALPKKDKGMFVFQKVKSLALQRRSWYFGENKMVDGSFAFFVFRILVYRKINFEWTRTTNLVKMFSGVVFLKIAILFENGLNIFMLIKIILSCTPLHLQFGLHLRFW